MAPDRRPRLRLGISLLLILSAAVTSLVISSVSERVAADATAQTDPEETPQPLYALPDARFNRAFSSSSMALGDDNRLLAAANFLGNTVTLLLPAQGEVLAEIPVGRDPRSVALTPDSTRVLVANRGDNTLSVVGVAERQVIATIPLGGVAPYGVVTDRDDRAYVTLQGSDEVVLVDLTENRVIERIPVGDAPAGMALWADFLYVTHFWSGKLSLIYLPQRRVVVEASTGLDTGLFNSMEIDVTRGIAYLPQTRSNAQNINLTYDTTVFPIVNTVDLRTLSPVNVDRITLSTADQPVNMPFAAALDRFREWLYVVNAGTNDVSVIDLNNARARGHFEVGSNPRGILLNQDSTLLFVHSVLDGTITVVDTDTLQIEDVIPITNLTVSADILIGAQLFHNADDPRLSTNGWISCANCHFDGQTDHRVWSGFIDGPRNTPVLYGLLETAPYTWAGRWDELADVELKIRWLQAGLGLIDGPVNAPLGNPHGGLSPDLDTLTVYLTSLTPPQNPNQFDAALLERGAAVFADQQCAACHIGTAGTNLQPYDVGTGLSALERAGMAFDTPSLRWLWISAPYFHDGSAATLRDVFTLPGVHQLVFEVQPADIDALVAYLLSLPSASVP